MAVKGKAKYYCENCGSEVGAAARFCPKCGKFFSAVRCPQCGHSGSPASFKNGCPACHYTVPSSESQARTLDGQKHGLSKKSRRSIKTAFATWSVKNGLAPAVADGAPAWVFFVCIAALAAIFAVIFVKLR